jgi:hypothetical protein
MLLEQRREPLLDGLPRFGPARLAQLAVAAHERAPKPVGVLVQGLEAVCLGADEAAAEDVVGVAADRLDVAVIGLDP